MMSDELNMAFVSGGLLSPQNGSRNFAEVLHKLDVLLGVAAIRDHMVAAIAKSAVCIPVHGEGVRHVLFTRRCKSDLTHYFCPCFSLPIIVLV